MLYNVKFEPHKRTSLLVKPIESCIVEAKNKASAKELAIAIVRDIYNDDYMTKQYSYIITKEMETNIY